MNEFVINVSMVLLTTAQEPPLVHTSKLCLTHTGEKVVVMSIKSTAPDSECISIKNIDIHELVALSLEEQQKINYLGYLD